MLYEIMKHLRNFFYTGISKEGAFSIKGGTISLPFVSSGAYILIEGSLFNDGVYAYPATELEDEDFEGVISVLAPPKALVDLADEIETFVSKTPATDMKSESFGGYSYDRVTTASGNVASWQDVYKARLNVWRKI